MACGIRKGAMRSTDPSVNFLWVIPIYSDKGYRQFGGDKIYILQFSRHRVMLYLSRKKISKGLQILLEEEKYSKLGLGEEKEKTKLS